MNCHQSNESQPNKQTTNPQVLPTNYITNSTINNMMKYIDRCASFVGYGGTTNMEVDILQSYGTWLLYIKGYGGCDLVIDK